MALKFENLDTQSKEEIWKYINGNLTEQLGLRPEMMGKMIDRARMNVSVGKADEAILVYGTALLLEPMNMDYLSGFANCALILNQPDMALHSANLMVALEPGNPAGYMLSGTACQMLGKLKEAAEDFTQALDLAEQANKSDIAAVARKMMGSLQ